jgi:2-polyprenyl-3-methyl-5-hydroxy-6-metoxy-1,4-benzoquinol methylase
MAVDIDPEGVETRVVNRLVDFLGKDVLEIGCRDGRLTWRYADRAASVLAIDPNKALIALAEEHIPDPLRSVVTFQAADISTFEPPGATFDVVVLAWCI